MPVSPRVRTRAALSWFPLNNQIVLVGALLGALLTAACGRSDATVQSDLQQQLAADPATVGAHLNVSVKDGVAAIAGQTDTMAQQQRAIDIARTVKGVKQVQSEMRLNDAALMEQVKQAIAADASIKDIPLQIEVKDAEVKLFSDKTNGDERARLREVAGGVPGVVHVEDNMK